MADHDQCEDLAIAVHYDSVVLNTLVNYTEGNVLLHLHHLV